MSIVYNAAITQSDRITKDRRTQTIASVLRNIRAIAHIRYRGQRPIRQPIGRQMRRHVRSGRIRRSCSHHLILLRIRAAIRRRRQTQVAPRSHRRCIRHRILHAHWDHGSAELVVLWVVHGRDDRRILPFLFFGVALDGGWGAVGDAVRTREGTVPWRDPAWYHPRRATRDLPFKSVPCMAVLVDLIIQ